MGFWSGLAKILPAIGGVAAAPFTGGASLIPTLLGAGGAVAGAVSQGKATNRGTQLGAQMDLEGLLMARDKNYQNMQIDRESEGRASGNDAWRRLGAAQSVINPGPRPQLSPYSVKPRQASAAELQGADAMTQEVMARLQGGNPIPQVQQRPLEVDRGLMEAGGWEKALGVASPFLVGAGALMGRRQPLPSRRIAGAPITPPRYG